MAYFLAFFLEFPRLDVDRIGLFALCKMVHDKLLLKNNEKVDLIWMVSITDDKDFCKMWNEANTDDEGWVNLTVEIVPTGDNLASASGVTSSTTIRKSPRIMSKLRDKVKADLNKTCARRLVINLDQAECMNTQASVADNIQVEKRSGKGKAVTVDGGEDAQFWSAAASLANVLEEAVEDFKVQLTNVEPDECHPVDDPELDKEFMSDEEDDDNEFMQCLKNFKESFMFLMMKL
ncbi:hypothetical protein MKX01_020653 [Papaver californicum]|nr:hypothetical protein MKX01_020653 [Papaver californicum]